jgi:hypothetical protein
MKEDDAEKGGGVTDELLQQVEELLRETFEGGLPGEGTQYLDRDSGIRRTLEGLTAAQASKSYSGHPSIASHARHMNFHLLVTSEWILGDHHSRDWKASFEPQTVTDAEWTALLRDLEMSRQELVRVLRSLEPEVLIREGAAMGAVAHLAYHLGAIRQLVHLVRDSR